MSALLSAENVTFGYGTEPLLVGWSADFQAGEVTAITGPSGRGKSTLLYLLGLMLRPREGRVIVKAESVSDRSDRERAALRASVFGFVFQDAALDATRSVLDNVIETALYRNEDRQDASRRAMLLLETFGVSERATHKPGQISGGQAQRIALCRALLNSPPILLADEPTGNLDAESAGVVIDSFRDHAEQGATIVVATHDPGLVSRCDRRISL